jgi:hypothetical protein
MNVYELSLGFTKHFVAARDEEHAYEQGTDAEKFPDIHYLPFVITQVTIPGVTITALADNKPIEDMDKSELKQWLKGRNVAFTPQLGEDKLRELALQHAS